VYKSWRIQRNLLQQEKGFLPESILDSEETTFHPRRLELESFAWLQGTLRGTGAKFCLRVAAVCACSRHDYDGGGDESAWESREGGFETCGGDLS
jgi:hypothetical protein